MRLTVLIKLFLKLNLNDGIFHDILSIPHNIITNLYNVMPLSPIGMFYDITPLAWNIPEPFCQNFSSCLRVSLRPRNASLFWQSIANDRSQLFIMEYIGRKVDHLKKIKNAHFNILEWMKPSKLSIVSIVCHILS